ncbi:putative ABC transporter ATP-binding protein [Cyphellophora attinorum]|uniref:Putative ABC transporter ATP-binding protein n=1 Tax=Cyphellophora attinorum TaxID=1664694 RepID=A0A0N0NL84_9EURO|nr:putative ABC transporter ATP-binding protein [Phialophora attinorum]KPI39001.1 putative ABC transporter ATP-binding protein [Phialophora attinorum]
MGKAGLHLPKRVASSLINIRNGTFFREHPASVADAYRNPPLFPNLNFQVPLIEEHQGQARWPPRSKEHWAVISAKGGTALLEILRGAHFCEPLSARTFPYLTSDAVPEDHRTLRIPSRAIQYVGFNPGQGNALGAGIQGAYLSARYESRRLTAEESDWTVRQYLKGQTTLNPTQQDEESVIDDASVNQVVTDLRLHKLLDMPVSNLSNGQTRRSRIAKALLSKPLLLLLDDPFMGLDPPTLVKLSPMLRDLAYASAPLLLLSLRPQDPIPDWITHLAVVGDEYSISSIGTKEFVLARHAFWLDTYDNPDRYSANATILPLVKKLTRAYGPPLSGINEALTENGIEQVRIREADRQVVRGTEANSLLRIEPTLDNKTSSSLLEMLKTFSTLPSHGSETDHGTSVGQDEQKTEAASSTATSNRKLGQPLIELESVVIKYGDKVVLGHPSPQAGHDKAGLNVTISEGTRLALIGPNGSGKTTFLSLLTSDHPQSYSLPIKFFGRSRLPQPGVPGLSLWQIQSRIGHSAPEVHAFFPKSLSVRQVLESAWAETYVSKPKLSYARDQTVDAFLSWWEPELRQDWKPAKIPPRFVTRNKPVNIATRGLRELIEYSYPPFIKDESSRWTATMTNVFTQNGSYKHSANLDWADDTSTHRFGLLPFAAQRLLLLLRAIIKQPDVLILDEAFSGLSSFVRDKAMLFLEHGETKYLPGSPDLAFMRNDMVDPPSHNGQPIDNKRIHVNRLVQSSDSYLHAYLQSIEKYDQPGQNFSPSMLKDRGWEVQMADQLLEYSKRTAQERLEGARNLGYDTPTYNGLTDKQALVVVSHIKEEVPAMCDEFIRLPGEEEVIEDSRAVEMGYVGRGGISDKWNWLWQSRKS